MIDYHHALISDTVRTEAFRQAIHAVVKSGDVVLDIGTGTGVMACFACQAGASRVYAIERESIIHTAKEIAAANGYENQITFLKGEAVSLPVPEPVDVIIGEVIGSIGLEENILKVFEAVSRRCLRPGGRVIPLSIDVLFAPWEAGTFYEELDFWGHEHFGLSLEPCRTIVMNQFYSISLDPSDGLADAQTLWRFSLPAEQVEPLSAAADFTVSRRGVLHGFAGWFSTDLSPDIRLSTSPSDPPTQWKQAFFPIERPVEVLPGDRTSLAVTAASKGGGMMWGWSGKIVREERELTSFSAHMFFGEIPASAPVVIMSRKSLPPRSEDGNILLEILTAMDGRTSLQELAEHLYNKFPHSFGDRESARQQILSTVEKWGLIGRV